MRMRATSWLRFTVFGPNGSDKRRQWEEVLTLLRGLLALRADDHALWAK